MKIKYISTEGLERTLAESPKSLFGHSKFPEVYGDLFHRLASALSPGMLNPFKQPETPPAKGAAQTP